MYKCLKFFLALSQMCKQLPRARNATHTGNPAQKPKLKKRRYVLIITTYTNLSHKRNIKAARLIGMPLTPLVCHRSTTSAQSQTHAAHKEQAGCTNQKQRHLLLPAIPTNTIAALSHLLVKLTLLQRIRAPAALLSHL